MVSKKLQMISFTTAGNTLAHRFLQILRDADWNYQCSTFSLKRECTDSEYVENLKEWTGKQFQQENGILFIGACGIAVRTIAPFLKDKLTDPPVLVMDEAGQFVIPLLSGHVGDANKIAVQLAELTGQAPVITTATDVQGQLAIDVFAKNHDLAIGNRNGIAKVSSKVLEHRKLTLSIAPEYASQVDIAIQNSCRGAIPLLSLIPREYMLGIGCRKGKDPAEMLHYVETQLEYQKISWKQVRGIATIDLKKEEPAIVQLSYQKHIPLSIFDADTLSRVQGDFAASDFVKQKTGVDNVCERAALAACEGKGKLIMKKKAENGMTLAIAKTEWRLTLYEE